MKFTNITTEQWYEFYWWKSNGIRENRVKYQKHKLIQMGWGTMEQTKDEIMHNRKI